MRTRTLIVAALSLIALPFVAARAAPPAQPPPAGFHITGDAKAGAHVYASSCETCHGKHGDGAGVAGKALTPPPFSFIDPARTQGLGDWEMFSAVKHGGATVKLSAAMPAFGDTLTDKQIDDVLAYVKATFIEPHRAGAAQ